MSWLWNAVTYFLHGCQQSACYKNVSFSTLFLLVVCRRTTFFSCVPCSFLRFYKKFSMTELSLFLCNMLISQVLCCHQGSCVTLRISWECVNYLQHFVPKAQQESELKCLFDDKKSLSFSQVQSLLLPFNLECFQNMLNLIVCWFLTYLATWSPLLAWNLHTWWQTISAMCGYSCH